MDSPIINTGSGLGGPKDRKNEITRDTILTKDELQYYQNLKDKWRNLMEMINNPPENSKLDQVEDHNIRKLTNDAEQLIVGMEKFIRNKDWSTEMNKWVRKQFGPYMWFSGDLSMFKESLETLNIMLDEIHQRFNDRHNMSLIKNSSEQEQSEEEKGESKL